MEFNEETPALDAVHKRALSADLLGAEHTARHVREDWQPRLVDRRGYEQGEASGGTSMRDRARAKIDVILAERSRHVLPPDVERQIKTVADRAVAAQTR